jgi:hypothetical protein
MLLHGRQPATVLADVREGRRDNANGKYEEAIGHYKNAWDLAT